MFIQLEEINTPPEPFQFYTAADLWTDEHTSKQMLRFHLDEGLDVSSRNIAFIDRSVDWIVSHFNSDTGKKIADFGCGPGPALIAMGRESGFDMAGYDKFYADQPELLTRRYDFITSTEVIEHLAAPRAVLDGLWACLNPGGVLVLQTQRVLGDERFKSWRYRHDPTHIVFFAEASFRALAASWQADLCFPHTDVAVFTKP